MELEIQKKSIKGLLCDENNAYLAYKIPEYQRPYSWNEDHCQILWDDLKSFAESIKENKNTKKENNNINYFLGSIVFFKTDERNGVREVVDGQQRIVTFTLLLKAFYVFLNKSNKNDDEGIKQLISDIKKCIWNINEDYQVLIEKPKIINNVIDEDAKQELKDLLEKDIDIDNKHLLDNCKSQYAKNYKFFLETIDKYNRDNAATGIQQLPKIIIENTILLLVGTNDQDSALDIFSTLNDRGLSLSDSDILKYLMYKEYKRKGSEELKNFLEKWNEINIKCKNINIEVNELFRRYIYYDLSKKGNIPNTLKSLRNYYKTSDLLNKKYFIDDLLFLADIWEDVQTQQQNTFSIEILEKFFILENDPNNLWRDLVSVYFLKYKNEKIKNVNDLNDFYLMGEAAQEFSKFLDVIIIFDLLYGFYKPGNSSLKQPMYKAMVKIVNTTNAEYNKESIFSDYMSSLPPVNSSYIKSIIDEYDFSNRKPLTKFILRWWALYYKYNIKLCESKKEDLLDIKSSYEIEHIIAKKSDKGKKYKAEYVEKLGNKSILEKQINIICGKLPFDKKLKEWEKSKIYELKHFTEKYPDIKNKKEYTQTDIDKRTNEIINAFIEELEQKGLIKSEKVK